LEVLVKKKWEKNNRASYPRNAKGELRDGDNVVGYFENGYDCTLKQWDGHHTLKNINRDGLVFDLREERYSEAKLWGRMFTMIRVRR
jgi:hypothetical protein